MSSHLQKIELKINGTHCTACEVLIERKFKKIHGVEQAEVNYATGRAQLYCSRYPRLEELERVIRPHGYSIDHQEEAKSTNIKKDYFQIGAIFLVVVALYLILKQLRLIPDVGISDNMNYGLVFAIGLVAAVSTCMAVTGGLLLAVAAKYNEQHPELTGIQRFRSHLYFNIGRVASYTILGGAVGGLGSVLSLSTTVNGIVTIAVSLVMVILGLQLLKLFPWLARFQPRMPKFIAHRIYEASASRMEKTAPFLFGASTFFLPCGFTQALQLYVLSQGSVVTGALTMLIFSLGTLPALLSVSALASFLKGAWQKYFLKFAGVVVVLIGIFNISRGLALAGIQVTNTDGSANDTSVSAGLAIDPNVNEINGVQVVRMSVNGYEYSPSRFTVKKGVPVEWQIDGRKAAGCAQVITIPRMGITEYLPRDSVKTIRFTPAVEGKLAFSCTMGMTTPGAAFTVVEAGNSVGQPSANTNTAPAPSSISDCDPRYAMCLPAQKLSMEITKERGFYPNTFTVKVNAPVELEIDTKVPLSGCMSTLVIPDYNIAHRLTLGKTTLRFTPTKVGTAKFTCSMGSWLGQFIVTE